MPEKISDPASESDRFFQLISVCMRAHTEKERRRRSSEGKKRKYERESESERKREGEVGFSDSSHSLVSAISLLISSPAITQR